MNYKFIQPVSMRVTKEQYERDLREPLLKMGYEEACMIYWDKNLFLATFSGVNNPFMTNIKNGRGFVIPEYNPKLFLAIAAMTDKETPIVGEWLVCIDEMAYIISGYKVGEFVKNGNPNIELNWFRRATLQELIEKYTNQKQDIMKKEITNEQFNELKNLIAPENVEKFDELMGLKKPIPKKEELITGDKVILRNGNVYLVIRDCNAGEYGEQVFVFLECKINMGFMNSGEYDEELCDKDGYREYDVMKIYRYKEGQIRGNSFSTDLTGYSLIWER